MKRSGIADLPLHGGRVPQWLATRMTMLGTAIAETIILQYGRSAFLSRLSDPFWFQAYGSVMGMDWHSSGITTSVMGALKRGLNERAGELGLYVCGGRGRHSRNTPAELQRIAEATSMDGGALVRASRLTARIDNNAVDDGFQIYLHSFVLSADGEWAVVQQGMNEQTRLARRYHWHSPAVGDFVADPHTAIVGASQGTIRNLVDRRAGPARQALLTIVHDDPAKTLAEFADLRRSAPPDLFAGPLSHGRRLQMPAHHDVRQGDVNAKRLGAVLALAHERELRDFASFLLLEQLGPRTLQSLSLIAEVVHGAPTRFDDPARFAFAHGGKDGHPFPVPLKVYDDSLGVLRRALNAAKLGRSEKLDGMKRLDTLSRAVEAGRDPFADVHQTIARERKMSPSLGGRTVFDDVKGTPPSARRGQLTLFTR